MNISWQYLTAVVNTQHLSERDMKALLDNAVSPTGEHGLHWVSMLAGGVLVRITAAEQGWQEELIATGVSQQAINNIELLVSEGFCAVQFDCDGDVITELAIHAWDDPDSSAHA